MKHRFKVTLERLSEQHGEKSQNDMLQFEVENHDDIFKLVDRMKNRGDFTKETSEALVVGLKIFSEVMLENRKHPLFTSFAPHFKNFMTDLKGGPQKPTAHPE
ncbi:MAG TPA: DUF3861 domain-containing protein [Telmatospirillum sp.]|nr:DUF3861 domain-containing protein [Telmatospirillum sp.]